MLTSEAVEKAIEMYERGATELAVAEATGISREEARAVADAVYVGETERLFREVTLAVALEAAAQALGSGRGSVKDTPADVVREIWHSYPNAGIKVTDRRASARAGDFKRKGQNVVRGTCNILVKRNGALEECGKPSVYSQPCLCDRQSHCSQCFRG